MGSVLDRIRLNQIKSFDFFIEYYNKYVKYYNDDNHLSVLSDLLSIQNRLDNRYNQMEEKLNKTVEGFKISFFELCDKKKDDINYWDTIDTGDYNIEDFPELSLCDSLCDDLVVKVESVFCKNRFYEVSEDELDDIFNLSIKIYETVRNSDYKGFGSDEIYEAVSNYDLVRRLKLNSEALKLICNRILDSGYPEKLKLMGEMTEAEQEQIIKEIGKIAGRKNKKAFPKKRLRPLLPN